MRLNDISKSIHSTNLHWYNHRISHYMKSKSQLERKTIIIENNTNPLGLLLNGIAKQTSCYEIPWILESHFCCKANNHDKTG